MLPTKRVAVSPKVLIWAEEKNVVWMCVKAAGKTYLRAWRRKMQGTFGK